MIIAARVLLLLLHAPNGREILLNPAEIVVLSARVPHQKNVNVPDTANCVINTSDGKFISVLESCEVVSQKIEELTR